MITLRNRVNIKDFITGRSGHGVLEESEYQSLKLLFGEYVHNNDKIDIKAEKSNQIEPEITGTNWNANNNEYTHNSIALNTSRHLETPRVYTKSSDTSDDQLAELYMQNTNLLHLKVILNFVKNSDYDILKFIEDKHKKLYLDRYDSSVRLSKNNIKILTNASKAEKKNITTVGSIAVSE
ncbi:hypothetical protein AX774_g90 [Zancudomyces culisetae]|uniref:Uncharacterized protein n=1 Tax=Zancudomyces culisetae TaxID=1213189 RepID=A0A1R1PZE1_ZANCU|nr:hypothetical protein AX774_g90 [Zancudomyces culisetae]|eukprot:OMH86332.1 hypothetical protein AX774_g90 [Zancudomyces culisetae]